MNPIYTLIAVLGLVGISGTCLGQQNQLLNSENHTQDSIAINQRQFLSGATLYLKTQYPIQHGVGVEVATPFFFSGHIGVGQLSSFYVKSALEFLPQEDDAQVKRKKLIQDNLKDGFVFEFGTQYHLVKWRNLYVGLNLQVQKFTIHVTPQEVVEEYDFGNTQAYSEEVLGLVQNVPALNAFYKNATLVPSLTAIQLEAKLGKRIHFKNLKKLFLDIELSYQSNLSSRISIKTPSQTGDVLVERFVRPILDEGTENSFSSFAFPTVGVRLSYQIGDKVHY
ncbi:MAG: hypothetical protein AAFO07_16420 [Bacteroidota bacterium]